MTSKHSFRSLSISIILALIALVLPARIGPAAERAKTGAVDEAKQRAAATYVKLPLSFEINQGQTDPRVKFLSRGRGYALFLTGSEAVLSLEKPSGVSGQPAHNRSPKSHGPWSEPNAPAVLRLELVGANPAARVTGLEELPGKTNYFLGNDPGKWRTNVPTFAKVKYENIYPSVDLVYHGNPSADGQLEYDFVVSPGGDPRAIRLDVRGDSSRQTKDGGLKPRLKIDVNSDLIVQADGGEVRFQKPVVYQPMADDAKPQVQNREPLDGRYVLLAGNRVGFEIPNYDKTKLLVIDPVLSYSTYLGGSGVEAGASSVSVAVDASGNAYVASGTSSTDFPGTSSGYQPTNKGASVCTQSYPCGDAVVAKIDPTGSTLLYSTYLGGSGDDYAYGLAVDSGGNAYVSGVTNSTNFPTTSEALQTGLAGGYDIFVTKLNATGSALVYSTYLGGEYDEYVEALSIDSFGDAYVAGGSSSPNFPTTSGAYDTTFSSTKANAMACGTSEAPEPCPYAIVTELNPMGTGLIYSTFLGGSGDDSAGGLAVDSSGAAYVTGWTSSTNFPTLGAFQTSLTAVPCGPGWQCPNAFFSKLNPQGKGTADLVYSTYLGGTGNEYTLSAAVDSSGNAYVVGLTSSNDFPITTGAFQTTHAGPSITPGCNAWSGCAHAFVSKINPATSGSASLVYSTYLSGSGNDWGAGIDVDSSGNAYVTGMTTSTDFPTLYPLQAANAGGEDAFVTELNATGTGLIFSTYLGGSGNDLGDSIAVDSSGNLYVGGWTESANFPTTPGSVQPLFGGARDLFVAKILTSLEVSAGTLTFPLTAVGSTTPLQTLTLTNNGTEPMSVNITITPGFSVVATTCGTTLGVGDSCTITIASTPTGPGTQEGQLTISGPPGGPAVVPLTVEGILPGNIATLAGGGRNSTVATTALVAGPTSVAVDTYGNIFILAQNMSAVFKADPSGNFTLVAGGTVGYGGDGGPATSASLNVPWGVAVDSAGNLFIADDGNSRIRRVDASTGIITTVAGNGSFGFSGDGYAATNASLNGPAGVAVDSSGNLYIADTNNNRIRMVAGGVITTVAGGGSPPSGIGDGGAATSATLNRPFGVAVDSSGNLYITDSNDSRIRVVNMQTTGPIEVADVTIPVGCIATVAGTGTAGYGGDGGLATSAALYVPSGVAVDGAGNVFIADRGNERVRVVNTQASGIITVAGVAIGAGDIATVAGNGSPGFTGDNGAATSASLNNPWGVAVDGSGNLFIADTWNNRIRRVAATGTINTMAGGGSGGDGGPATSALLVVPYDVAPDSGGNLFIADTYTSRIRRVDATTGTITTVAGNGTYGFGGDGGPATSASLSIPEGVAVDGSGNLFIADANNNRIRKVAAGLITTVAGGGSGGDGEAATSASLNGPAGVAVDSSGNLFIADQGNSRIRRVDATTGYITTVAGGGSPSSGIGDNGPATSASLNLPSGVAVDGSGNLFIADSYNWRIRVVNMQATAITVAGVTILPGDIATVAGNGTPSYGGDGGPAASASLDYPRGVAVDGSGSLFIADTWNSRIRRVDGTTGIITTVAGYSAVGGFSGDGGPATSATLYQPDGVAVGAAGSLFIADTWNNRIREVLVAPAVTFSTTSLSFGDQLVGTSSPWQTVTVTNTGNLALTISGIAASGDFAQTSTCPMSPATLNIGSTCTISVNFTPTVAGSRAGTVTITDNAAGSPQTVELSGTGVALFAGMAVSLAPPNLVFPATAVGTSSSLVVTLTNTGVSPVTILSIATSPTGGNYTQTNTCPVPSATLAPLATCSISVTFTPTVTGSDPGTLTITDNASDSPQSVPLAATYTTPPQPVSAGTTTTFTNGTIMTETVTLPSDAVMNGTASKAVSFIPMSPAAFSATRLPGTPQYPNWSGGITPIPAETTCTLIANTGGNCIVIRDLCFDKNGNSMACNIAAGPTDLIQLTAKYETTSSPSCPGYIIADDNQPNWAIITNQYSPGDTGIGGGTKTLNTDTTVVDLGAGYCATSKTGPAVSLAPLSLVFPAQEVGTASSPLVVTLTNSGVAPLTISNIATSGDYVQTNTCPIPPATLAVGTNCSITVTFTPTVSGIDPGMLTITDNASDSPQSVPLATSTPQQAVSPGATPTFSGTITFANGTTMTETVLIPPDAVMNNTAFKAVSFIEMPPDVFSSERLPGTTQSPNWSGGTTPIPAATTCTVIANTGGNCIVIRDLCFDKNSNSIACDIVASTIPIQLAYHYETPSSPSCPAYVIADDDQKDWADITNEYSPNDTGIGGGTKTLNTDTAVVDLGAGNCASATLTITATPGSASMIYGATPPTITPTYSGFVNGNTSASLTTQPTCATFATSSSPVEIYPYPSICWGAVDSNYTIRYVDGTVTVTQARPAITWGAPTPITYGTALSAAQLDASSPVAGAFAYSPTAGTVLTAGTQTLSVTFTPTDTTDYTTATGSVALTVNKATPAIAWAAPAAITYGTALGGTQLDASSPVAGTFAYSPTAGTVLTAGTQALSVTFTPTDTTDYTTATGSVALTVNKATPAITWAAPAAITYGTALSATQLDATANVPGSFVYAPAAGAVLTAGTHTLSVTFTPTDTTDYTTATGTVTLTVSQATPTITWATPAAIIYGTALSTTQLDATANVPGSFVYTPAAGTVLTAGTHTLSVTFTPSDTTDYSTATATVTLTVNKATPVLAWTPASIELGYPLTNAQLDATANVPGTFVYTPPLGTVINTTSQTLSVLFAPTDTTDYTTASMSVSLTVTPGPLASVSPSSINFGTVYLGTITVKSVTLTNVGNAAMTISTPFFSILSGGTLSEFVAVNLCPSSLPAGKSCTIQVGFIAGPYYSPQTATLSIVDNAYNSPQTVLLSATVINPQAWLSATSLSFGTQKKGTTSAAQAVTLKNTGATTLTISTIALAGADPGDFPETNNCPASLAPTASCTISVTFKPTTTGSRSGKVVITDNAWNSPQSISLSGTGN